MGNCFRRAEETYDLPSTTKIIYDVYQKLRQRGLTKNAAASKTSYLTGIHPVQVRKIVSDETIFQILIKKAIEENAKRQVL